MMKKIAIAGLLLLLVVTIASMSVPVSATAVDRLSITDNQGYAGDVIEIPITLESTSEAARRDTGVPITSAWKATMRRWTLRAG